MKETYSRTKSVWQRMDETERKAVMDYGEKYKAFLDTARTERLAAKEIIRQAEAKGFKPVYDMKSLKAGDKVYWNQKDKSVILAVMASGLNGQSFAFNGYLPVKPDERTRAIRAFERRAREGQAQLFIETPYRNVKLAEQLLQLCAPQTMLTVACDLTAPGETILTRSVADWRRSRLPELNRRPAIFILG